MDSDTKPMLTMYVCKAGDAVSKIKKQWTEDDTMYTIIRVKEEKPDITGLMDFLRSTTAQEVNPRAQTAGRIQLDLRRCTGITSAEQIWRPTEKNCMAIFFRLNCSRYIKSKEELEQANRCGMPLSDSVIRPCFRSLVSLILPDSITRIEPYAFPCFKFLEHVTVPENGCTVEKGAFAGCCMMRNKKEK